MKDNLPLKETFDFSNLRTIGSTGSALPPEVFEWIYDHVSKGGCLCLISGGTDVCTAFVGGTPSLPIQKGYIQSRSLGGTLHTYNENGEQVIGSLGEMVIENQCLVCPFIFGSKFFQKS